MSLVLLQYTSYGNESQQLNLEKPKTKQKNKGQAQTQSDTYPCTAQRALTPCVLERGERKETDISLWVLLLLDTYSSCKNMGRHVMERPSPELWLTSNSHANKPTSLVFCSEQAPAW